MKTCLLQTMTIASLRIHTYTIFAWSTEKRRQRIACMWHLVFNVPINGIFEAPLVSQRIIIVYGAGCSQPLLPRDRARSPPLTSKMPRRKSIENRFQVAGHTWAHTNHDAGRRAHVPVRSKSIKDIPSIIALHV